ncbi:hypothetical protein CFIO01_02871 [Colletotrichum fioriniae PJ7]|uniref:Uncharacterized protein n=1 Tax=Colletotrichum fioriniae PJ7 TaxID=1445577 RepID=A0A010R792_9PEZI|nr:hypothetical protein CFIO01_02871 [Colletotrichum fioriniae PJ7]
MEQDTNRHDKCQSQVNHAQYYLSDMKSRYSTVCMDGTAPEAFSGSSTPPQVWPFNMAGMAEDLPPEQAVSEQNELDFRVEATAKTEEPEGETMAERLFGYLMCNPAWALQAEKNKMFHEAKLSVDQTRTWDFITGSDLFRKFVRRNTQATRRLLITAGEHHGEVISTTKILAATIMTLSASERDTEDVIPTFVIGWFCADDTQMWDRTDPDKPVNLSSRLMMTSLVCQLLDAMMTDKIECDLSFIDRTFALDEIAELDLSGLSKMFSRLVLKVPEGRQIVCVIDEICRYDGPGGDARCAIEKLVALTKELLNGPRYFKLLLTCGCKGIEMREDFESKDLFSIKSDDQTMEVPQGAEILPPCPNLSAGLKPRDDS